MLPEASVSRDNVCESEAQFSIHKIFTSYVQLWIRLYKFLLWPKLLEYINGKGSSKCNNKLGIILNRSCIHWNKCYKSWYFHISPVLYLLIPLYNVYYFFILCYLIMYHWQTLYQVCWNKMCQFNSFHKDFKYFMVICSFKCTEYINLF